MAKCHSKMSSSTASAWNAGETSSAISRISRKIRFTAGLRWLYFEAVASVRAGDARDGAPPPAVPSEPSDIALVWTRCWADTCRHRGGSRREI